MFTEMRLSPYLRLEKSKMRLLIQTSHFTCAELLALETGNTNSEKSLIILVD